MRYDMDTGNIIQTKTERCGNLCVEYSLWSHRSSIDGQQRFGLSCRFYDDRGLKGEDSVSDVTSDPKKAEELLDCLVDGFVTPLGLRDVLEELI